MARGMLFLFLLVVLVHETWSAKDDGRCVPSSCGNIQNISYPFALKDDPETCGDLRYRLSCENNQTVLHLYAGKYNVREINYTNFIIRVSDSGIQENDNHSIIPDYFLSAENFTKVSGFKPIVIKKVPSTPWDSSTTSIQWGPLPLVPLLPAVFVSCKKPVNFPIYTYVNISACFINSSKGYRYILLSTDEMQNDTCQVEKTTLTSLDMFYSGQGNDSCSDVHDYLVFGFELSWQQVYCGSSCAGINDTCYFDDANKFGCLVGTDFNTVNNGAQKILILLLHISFFHKYIA
jgi:hypothetical protein